MNAKDSFIFYRSWSESIRGLPDKTRLAILDAIIDYVFSEEKPTLPPELMFGFTHIKEQIDRDLNKWEDIKQKRSEAGRKGNEKRWGKAKDSIANATFATTCNRKTSQTIANIAEYVDVDVYGLKEKVKKENAVAIATTNLEGRQKAFYDELAGYIGEFGQGMVMEFYNYWSEPNKSRTKFRKELEKTWETKRRLTTWRNRQKQYGSATNTTSNAVATGESVIRQLEANEANGKPTLNY